MMEAVVADDTKPDAEKLNPGDVAEPGTPGTGENVCPICRGTKTFNNEPCRNCGGTGQVVAGVGGA